MKALRHAIGFGYRLLGGDAPGPGGWVHWLMPVGLATGALMAWLLALSWSRLHLYGYGLWMAMLPVLLLYWLGPGAGRLLAGAECFSRLRQGRRLNAALPTTGEPLTLGLFVLAVATAVVVYFAAAATLPTDSASSRVLGAWIARHVRHQKLYVALLLMPAWGNAGVVLIGLIGRPAADADPSTRHLLARAGWVKMLWGWVAPTGLTVALFTGWWTGAWASALALSVILFGLIMLCGWLMARRGQGHCRRTLLAGGLLAELAFLITFHAMDMPG
jgi:hypothetical protein